MSALSIENVAVVPVVSVTEMLSGSSGLVKNVSSPPVSSHPTVLFALVS